MPTPLTISISENAAKHVREFTGKEKGELISLRVGVKGGGCSGFSYTLDLTETRGELDEAWEQHEVTVICDPKSHLYVDGTTVDFKDELMGRGFVFTNPNATSTCGCGSSFSA